MKKPKLFLMHFAGGNCYSFQFLMPFLTEFELVVLELPGRGQRMVEQLLLDFERATEDVFQQVMRKLDKDDSFMIYGHSMGGYLTLSVSHRLEQVGLKPAGIVISGNAGPGTDLNADRFKLQGAEFIQELRKLGGVPEEVLQNKDMFNFFAPILRADFRLAAENNLENKFKVSVPIYALMGDQEDTVNRIANWENYTTAPFESQIWKGDHFFIHQHREQLGALIGSFYQNCILQVSA